MSSLISNDKPAPKGPVFAFDTSGAWITAGLSGLAPLREEMSRGQAERLLPLLEECLTTAGLAWADLSALAVGVGPGNFTGVRISVAAARGLALALKIPAVGVSQFEVQLAGALQGRYLVSLPAPQGRAYVQAFADGKPQAAPAMLTPGEVGEGFEGLTVIGWQAAEIAAGLGLLASDHPYWGEVEGFDLPAVIAQIAADHLSRGENLPRPAPLYVRPADAAPPSDPPPVILDA